jgi:hypothetical protein
MLETDTLSEEPTPLSAEEATTLHYLTAADLEFFRHGAGLRLTVKNDRSYIKVSLVRIFPLSEPARYISVRYGDIRRSASSRSRRN